MQAQSFGLYGFPTVGAAYDRAFSQSRGTSARS
jgi:hypothetical protein